VSLQSNSRDKEYMAEGAPGEGMSQTEQKKPYLIYTTKNILVNDKWKWIKNNVLLFLMLRLYYRLVTLLSIFVWLTTDNLIPYVFILSIWIIFLIQ